MSYGFSSGSLSTRDFLASIRNQLEERLLKNKISSLELQEKRFLRRHRSDTRLLKLTQEVRLGNLALGRVIANESSRAARLEVCSYISFY